MWEYFCGGYEVEWVKGEEKHERAEVRKWLQNIWAKARPQRIVYFEDPFGRTRYEKREYLEKEVGTIIEDVKNTEDSYVIITSREEVFKKFEKDKLSAVDIKEFEQKLNLMRPSYDYEKRKEIVTRWAEKSEETAKAFAEEIRNMSWDKIVFLSFLFVSTYHLDFLRNVYEEMVEKLRLEDAWRFDEVLDWFQDDKVSVSAYVEFSHPSYSEALKYLIGGNDPFRWKYREIFGRNLLFILAEEDETAGSVAQAVIQNLDKLPEDVRNLIFILAEKDETAWRVAWIVIQNFDKLPEDVRDRLLFILAEKDKAVRYVAWIVIQNFDKLPEDVRNLIFILAEKDKTAGSVTEALAWYFDELPEDVMNRLFFVLAEKDETAWDVAWIVARNFDKLPEGVRNLLFILAEKDETAEDVARVVARNFDKLPEDVRNNLLLKLSKKRKAAKIVRETIISIL